MATVQKAAGSTKRQFIGRAWENEVKKEGATKGVKFLNLKLDRGLQITLDDTDQITLWPNTKRAGKQDADFRASIQVAA